MLKLLCIVMNIFCSLEVVKMNSKTSYHLFSCQFNERKFDEKKINSIRIKGFGLKRNEFDIVVKSFFFTNSYVSVNFVITNLISKKNKIICNTFSISFYDEKNMVLVSKLYKIKTDLYNVPSEKISPRMNEDQLKIIFYELLQKLLKDDKGFYNVPKSSILYSRYFISNYKYKVELVNYFNKSRGLKLCLDSLNKHLSNVKNDKDLSEQISTFIEEVKEHLSLMNKLCKNDEYCQQFDGLDEKLVLKKIMCDILTFLEICIADATPKTLLSLTERNINSHIVHVKIIPICSFIISEIIYKKNIDKIRILISDKKIENRHENDVWVVFDQLYLSRSFCNLYQGQECNIEIYKLREKNPYIIKLKIPRS